MLARLTKKDYMLLAEKKGFEHLGRVPKNVKEKTAWRCLRCGREIEITYRGMQGCRCSCKRFNTKQPDDYHALAEELGIRWLYDPQIKYSFPGNSYQATSWENPETHEVVLASWHQLTHYLPKALAEKLGIEAYAERRTAVSE